MPRTKLQKEFGPKYKDFSELPGIITSTVLTQSYYQISQPTARKFIENIPGSRKIGNRAVVSKKVFGEFMGEV